MRSVKDIIEELDPQTYTLANSIAKRMYGKWADAINMYGKTVNSYTIQTLFRIDNKELELLVESRIIYCKGPVNRYHIYDYSYTEDAVYELSTCPLIFGYFDESLEKENRAFSMKLKVYRLYEGGDFWKESYKWIHDAPTSEWDGMFECLKYFKEHHAYSTLDEGNDELKEAQELYKKLL